MQISVSEWLQSWFIVFGMWYAFLFDQYSMLSVITGYKICYCIFSGVTGAARVRVIRQVYIRRHMEDKNTMTHCPDCLLRHHAWHTTAPNVSGNFLVEWSSNNAKMSNSTTGWQQQVCTEPAPHLACSAWRTPTPCGGPHITPPLSYRSTHQRCKG